MAYRKGGPLLDRSPPFAFLSAVVLLLCLTLAFPLAFFLYRRRSFGRETLRALGPRKPVIIVSNHCLLLDPLLLAPSIFPRLTYFTLLEETVLAPWLGTFTRLLGGIPVPRDRDSLARLDEAVDAALAARGSIHFYPEGECYRRSQEPREFKPGAFWHAIRRGLPVLPVVTVLKPRGSARSRAGARPPLKAELHVLPPMDPPPATGRPAEDLRAAVEFAGRVRAAMQARIDEAGGDKGLYLGPLPRLKGVHRRR